MKLNYLKTSFYIGIIALALFEILKVYFIMPMPGSQQMDSIDLAYFLHSWRWAFRILFALMIVIGTIQAFSNKRKWLPLSIIILTAGIVYLFNFKMLAEKMFLQAEKIEFSTQTNNQLAGDRLVIGVENNGDAKAYPIEFLAYHHQVRDSVGGKPVMVTYCSVCRTGRVFEPVVNGKPEDFRLVGMNHFNAMFEDVTTKSWWRQSTGEAITGELKGNSLPEIHSIQMSVKEWFTLYPNGKIMRADDSFLMVYDSLARFERGQSKGSLTRTDSLSWKDKSWVVGIQIGNYSKAYDWNDLKKQVIINDSIGLTPIVLVLSSDGQSFTAFERPSAARFTVTNNIMVGEDKAYNLLGEDLTTPGNKLKKLYAYQEFWHSWLTFHPMTQQYSVNKNRNN